LEARKRGINISYTAEAPAPAVADLTIGLIFNLLRSINIANQKMHEGFWKRYFGRRIQDVIVGVIGAGRIGRRVIELLNSLGVREILVNDTNQSQDIFNMSRVRFVEKTELYSCADVITIHVPLNAKTRNMIGIKELTLMHSNAILINTARGGIVNEVDLFHALSNGHLAGAAVDVFEKEPYVGDLQKIERCILTAHMGSMSIDCRTRMEIEATEEAIRYFAGAKLLGSIPDYEYEAKQLNV
jgi:D-3-phosphoglycerate dehydrogenase